MAGQAYVDRPEGTDLTGKLLTPRFAPRALSSEGKKTAPSIDQLIHSWAQVDCQEDTILVDKILIPCLAQLVAIKKKTYFVTSLHLGET